LSGGSLLFQLNGNYSLATLLYNLGLFSARKAWSVIVAWLILLAITAGLALSLGGKLTTTMSIEGVPSQVVVDQLQKSFPEAGRGSGQVVFYKAEGAFTESDKQAISSALEDVVALPGISEAFDPFSVQAEIQDGAQELADGKIELVDAEQKIADGEIELAQAEIDIVDGEEAIASGLRTIATTKLDLESKLEQVNQGLKQMQDAGAPVEMQQELLISKAQLEGGLAELERQRAIAIGSRAQLEDGKIEISSAKTELEDGKVEIAQAKIDLAIGEKLLSATRNFSTVSSDESVALASIRFEERGTEVSVETRDTVVQSLSNANLNGIQVEFSQELTQSFGDILGIGEVIGLIAAAIVLFILLGTIIGMAIPIFSAITGVAISATLVLALASEIEMTSTTPILGVMLGLAVGIDYSLFIVNRHRRQLRNGMDLQESIGLANGTSGNAVLFAGITVVIALVALNLTGIGFVGLMGSMGAIAIVIAVAIALTVTPAALSLIGNKILSKKELAELAAPAKTKAAKTKKEQTNSQKPVWATRHPFVTVFSVVAVLGIMAIPLTEMRLGLPDGGSEPTDSTAFKAYSIISDGFGPGFSGQITTVLTTENPISEDDTLAFQADVASSLMTLDNVEAAVPAAIAEDQQTFIFQVVPTGGPSSVETEQLIYDIRELKGSFLENYGAEIGVTGITATNIDVSDKIAGVLPLYLGTVILLSLLLLMLVFRSILIPILAAAGFLLTVTATLGAVVAVYQWGWLGEILGVTTPGPILSFLPIFLIGILFGLAMDYQLFLVSGMREAFAHGKSPIDSINFGIHLSRGVVIAAALIMITVFGGFAFSHLATIRPIGFGLAIGVLIDAFLVRLFLVPAVMTIMNKSAWWIPKWIDQILPDVDVEGTKVEARQPAKKPAIKKPAAAAVKKSAAKKPVSKKPVKK
jgi:RND superfamily putative drug exporter